MSAPLTLVSQLLNRHKQFRDRDGYLFFIGEIVRRTGIKSIPASMTVSDIKQWNEYFTEWETFTEAKKCQYDVLAALEGA